MYAHTHNKVINERRKIFQRVMECDSSTCTTHLMRNRSKVIRWWEIRLFNDLMIILLHFSYVYNVEAFLSGAFNIFPFHIFLSETI